MHAGASGAVINHPEAPDTLDDVAWKVRRCEELGLESTVVVGSLEKGCAVAQLDPTGLLFEVPGDIESAAVTGARPDAIREFVRTVGAEDRAERLREIGEVVAEFGSS